MTEGLALVWPVSHTSAPRTTHTRASISGAPVPTEPHGTWRARPVLLPQSPPHLHPAIFNPRAELYILTRAISPYLLQALFLPLGSF